MFLYMPCRLFIFETEGKSAHRSVMHSEDMADHDLFATLLQERRSTCVAEEEKKALENLASFEAKHRKSLAQGWRDGWPSG
jgi:hypothetical protein